MELFKWRESYSVEVKTMDDDHKKLINFINQIYNLMLQKKPQQDIKPVLAGLNSYILVHFKKEENFFIKYNFPEYESHKKEHDTFIDKVESFYNDYNTNQLTLNMELLNFLKDWLKNHINVTDKKYTSFFHEKGLY